MTSRAMTRAAFFGHGSPMNTRERNRFTEAWRAFGRQETRPRAVADDGPIQRRHAVRRPGLEVPPKPGRWWVASYGSPPTTATIR